MILISTEHLHAQGIFHGKKRNRRDAAILKSKRIPNNTKYFTLVKAVELNCPEIGSAFYRLLMSDYRCTHVHGFFLLI